MSECAAADPRRRPAVRRSWLAAVLAISLMAAAVPAAGQETVYSCETGITFSSEPRQDGRAMMLVLQPGGVRVLLASDGTSAGDRYSGGGYVFDDRRHSVLLTRPGAAPVECRAGAANDRWAGSGPSIGGSAPARPATDATSGPSFACTGSLGPAEQEICATPALAGLDRAMADTFTWLLGELAGDRQDALRGDQRSWIGQRNGCGRALGCLEDQYYERIAYLNEYLEPGDPPAEARLPREARSWGGVVRSGPGTEYQRVTSLTEGTPITLLADTGVEMNGYNWFEIGWSDQHGYQWGGIVCPLGAPLAGAFDVCD